MKRKLFLCFFCLIVLFFNAFSQQKGHISGTVKDAETNESLVGVSIYVEQLKQGTTTNERGRYELDLPIGEHLLRVSGCSFMLSVCGLAVTVIFFSKVP